MQFNIPPGYAKMNRFQEKMKNFKYWLFIIVLLAAGAAALATSEEDLSTNRAEGFYKRYVEANFQNNFNRLFNSDYATRDFISAYKELQRAAYKVHPYVGLAYDPVMLGLDVAGPFEGGAATVAGESAQVVIENSNLEDSPVTYVDLRIDGKWRVQEVSSTPEGIRTIIQEGAPSLETTINETITNTYPPDQFDPAVDYLVDEDADMLKTTAFFTGRSRTISFERKALVDVWLQNLKAGVYSTGFIQKEYLFQELGNDYWVSLPVSEEKVLTQFRKEEPVTLYYNLCGVHNFKQKYDYVIFGRKIDKILIEDMPPNL